MFGSKEFIDLCKKSLAEYMNTHVDKTDNITVTEDDVYVVWYNKSLQNHKGLFSTVYPDGMYYEMTYNGDTHEMYLDAYKKWDNRVIEVKVDDEE